MHFFHPWERQTGLAGNSVIVHGYQQADSGLPKAASGAVPGSKLSGPTRQHVYLLLSFHRLPQCPSLLFPAKSLVWHFDKTPACSTLLQKGLSCFDKDEEPFCRMTLEKQGWASRSEASPCWCMQCIKEDKRHYLMLLTGWSLVPETAQQEWDGQRAAGAVSGLPTQSGCRDHLLQKPAVQWFLVGLG